MTFTDSPLLTMKFLHRTPFYLRSLYRWSGSQRFLLQLSFALVIGFVVCLSTPVSAAVIDSLDNTAFSDRSALEDVGRQTGAASASGPAQALLLDEYPDAYAAYSLRRMRSDYSGPAIRVRRSSDGAEQDFGFTTSGILDTESIESWLAGSDGLVLKWYSQLESHPALVPDTGTDPPLIARAGTVVTDSGGRPRLDFTAGTTVLEPESGLPRTLPTNNVAAMLVTETTGGDDGQGGIHLLTIEPDGDWSHDTPELVAQHDDSQYKVRELKNIGDAKTVNAPWDWQVLSISVSSTEFRAYSNHANVQAAESSLLASYYERSYFQLGGTPNSPKWKGYVGEVVMFGAFATDSEATARYDLINSYWETGPADYNKDVLLPQQKTWQVELYNWLETINESDVSIDPRPLEWDGTYSSAQQLANLNMALLSESPTGATRGEARWFVLDDGRGGGIEGSGDIQFYYRSKGDNSNEGGDGADAAFWYQLDVPLSNGAQGNYYYRKRAVALRALITSAVEMMLFEESVRTGARSGENDMYGKVLASAAYVYLHCKSELPAEVRSTYEEAMRFFVEATIEQGAQDINTNMDMFAVRAFAIISQSADDALLRERAEKAARRVLFGNIDGSVESNHDVHSGTFFPAGYIGENDGPETTYNGQSFNQLVRAYSYVKDDSDWRFLREVVRRMALFKQYQIFPDPDGFYTGPSAYSGRTGGSYVRDQMIEEHAAIYAADVEETRVFARRHKFGGALPLVLRDEGSIASDTERRRDSQNADGYDTIMTTSPPTFNAWSSWPPKHPANLSTTWRSTLKPLVDSNDPITVLPFERENFYFNKAFGGSPTGEEFWAYKSTDGTEDWGFFLEADAQQGDYHGWFGGKLETFWTENAGVVLLNVRSDKDDFSWDEIDTWGVQHVWGKDDTEDGYFTTAEIRGQREVNNLARTSVIETGASTPYAEVVNVFNDPGTSTASSESGEESGYELEGDVKVTNRFDVLDDGVRVTHMIASDQSDQSTELWATVPVNLRYGDGPGSQDQANIPDATIEYLDGDVWRVLPEDTDGDGMPELVSTTALRIGRDYQNGSGPQYAYLDLNGTQSVRVSTQVWQQGYQGYHRLRNIHIDLHGNPGTAAALPAEKSVSYTVQTTDPTADSESSTSSSTTQDVLLDQGWNIVSLTVDPSDDQMDQIFEGIAGAIEIVENRDGQTYEPGGANEIGSWNPEEAYRVYANESTTLQAAGSEVEPTETSIALEEGWNWVPYLRETSLPVDEALSTIETDLTIVKNEAGDTYHPAYGIDQLEAMEPGEGYKIYVEKSCTLTYPSN
jgi:hypothetical protein